MKDKDKDTDNLEHDLEQAIRDLQVEVEPVVDQRVLADATTELLKNQPAARLAPEASYGSAERAQRGDLQDLSRRRPWRFIVKRRFIRYGAVAGVAAIVLVALGLLPSSSGKTGSQSILQVGPSLSWAEQVRNSLQPAKAIVFRMQIIAVGAGGARLPMQMRVKQFYGADRTRQDTYYGDTLRETKWTVPEGDAMVITSVRFDSHSYSIQQVKGNIGDRDPVERMRHTVMEVLEKPDSMLDTRQIDGSDCIGFETHETVTQGDTRATQIERIWIDTQTKLPVLIEIEEPQSDGLIKSTIHALDQFQWAPTVPDDTFIPQIPSGFALGNPS